MSEKYLIYFVPTGWRPHSETFRWGTDIYMIPVFFLVTSIATTTVLYMSGILREKRLQQFWLRIVILLSFVRLVFALTTWDTGLLWPLLYGNPYVAWLPYWLRSAGWLTFFDTLLMAMALLYLLAKTHQSQAPQKTL